MVAEQEATGFKATETYKKTVVVNGQRTVVQVIRDGQVTNGGGVALPRADESVNPRVPTKIPSGYLPPHKRGKAASPTKDQMPTKSEK